MHKQLKRAIARDNRSTFLLSLLILIIALGIGYFTSLPYFRAMFSGGQRVTESQMAAGLGDLPQYFVSVKGSEMFDTGFYEERRWNFIPIGTAYFGALAVDDKLLLVQLPGAVSEDRVDYTGTVQAVSPEYNREIIGQLVTEMPELRGAFLPYLLDVGDSEQNWYWYAGAAVLIAAILGGLYGIGLAIARGTNPARHPIMKRLGRFNMDVEQLFHYIESDMAKGAIEVNGLRLSRDWIVRTKGGQFDVMRTPQVVWLYMHVLRTKYYGVVTVAKTFTAHIWDQHGTCLQVQAKEKDVQAMLTTIAQRAPWAVMGYSDDLKRMWEKNRDEFLRAIVERKRQVAAAG